MWECDALERSEGQNFRRKVVFTLEAIWRLVSEHGVDTPLGPAMTLGILPEMFEKKYGTEFEKIQRGDLAALLRLYPRAF